MPQTTQKKEPEKQNANIQVNVNEKAGCRIEMQVKAPKEMIEEARKKATKKVGKEISVPGFRKGKAPAEMISEKYGANIDKQLHKELADLAFVAAQRNVKIPVLNNNSPISFDLKKLAEDHADLLFSFETEPKIPEVEKSKFNEKPVKRAEVADKQINEAIRQMQFFYAQWKPVTDRPIQDGDYIMIDLDTIEENGELQRVFNHIRFEVSKDRMANWMKKLVEGAKSGDVLEGLSEADETATEEEKKEFKPKKVQITILKVEEAALPELNDEFAKKVGAKDVEQMKQSITDLLNKQADDKVQSELREQVNDFLIENYSFELPASLIETEKKHRLNQMLQDPKFKASWDKMSQDDRKKLDEKLAKEAKDAVSLFYLSRKIVQDAKIPVTHQEVQNEAISIYQSHIGSRPKNDELPKEIFALALSKVMLAKAQDHILKKA